MTDDLQRDISQHETALAAARANGDQPAEIEILHKLGDSYRLLDHNPDRAIPFYQQALDIARAIGFRTLEADSLAQLGDAYSRKDTTEGVEFYEQAVAIARSIPDHYREHRYLRNLGHLFNHIKKDHGRAKAYFDEALTAASQNGNFIGQAKSLLDVGSVVHELGNTPLALEIIDQSLDLARNIGDRRGEAFAYSQRGTIFHDTEDYTQSLKDIQAAVVIAHEIEDRGLEGHFLFTLALTHKAMNAFREAINDLEQAIILNREHYGGDFSTPQLNIISRLYEKLGDYPNAIIYMERFQAGWNMSGLPDRKPDMNAYCERQLTRLRGKLDAANSDPNVG